MPPKAHKSMKGPEGTVGYRLEDKDQGDEHHIFHWSDAYRTVHDLFINGFVDYMKAVKSAASSEGTTFEVDNDLDNELFPFRSTLFRCMCELIFPCSDLRQAFTKNGSYLFHLPRRAAKQVP